MAYVDYTDLNKACPKVKIVTHYLISIRDSTAGPKLLSFMGAYSGYNQPKMHIDDQEHTSFTTDKGICPRRRPSPL